MGELFLSDHVTDCINVTIGRAQTIIHFDPNIRGFNTCFGQIKPLYIRTTPRGDQNMRTLDHLTIAEDNRLDRSVFFDAAHITVFENCNAILQ